MNDQKHVVKIKKLHPDAVMPKYAHPGDAGFDLVAVEDVIIQPGKSASVPIGLAFELPQGMELQIRPRSGISKNTKLRISNSPGTVDCTYRGEVGVLFDHIGQDKLDIALTVEGQPFFTVEVTESLITLDGDIYEHPHELFSSGSYMIRKGDRIAQGVIAYVPSVILVEDDNLSETERGDGGFGSSGIES